MLFNKQHPTGLTEDHCSLPCRIPTRHGEHAIFPREPVPAGKGEIHIAGHRKHAIFPRNQFLQGKKKFTLGTDQQPFVDTDQKPFTNSCKKHNIDLPFKDTHKKGGMTTIIGMTAMIGITLTTTLRTVNMITTCILMSVQPQVSFSNKLD